MHITTIESNVFDGLNIESITFSTQYTVTTISNNAFKGLPLKNIVIGECGSIGDGAFSDCRYLESFSVSRLSTLGTAVFENCESLHTVEFPQTITSIPNMTFSHCTNITTFDFQNFVSIGIKAFYNTGLTNIAFDS